MLSRTALVRGFDQPPELGIDQLLQKTLARRYGAVSIAPQSSSARKFFLRLPENFSQGRYRYIPILLSEKGLAWQGIVPMPCTISPID